MKTRRAFTIIELSVGLIVMMITYAAISLSASSATQTAKHEAERLAAYIFRTIQKADRIHMGFFMDMDFEEKTGEARQYYVTITWQGGNEETDFKASPGCRYTDNFEGTEHDELVYNVTSRQFNTGGKITVTDSQGEVYFIKIGSTEGRIRLSEIDD